MSSKKINIDPKLFNLSSNAKTRSKRSVHTKIPAISPNILKTKLLKRIKEHKTKEIKSSHNEKQDSSGRPQLVEQSLLDVDKYNNEFDDSMSLLQSLSKDKKENDYRQHKKAEINRKTLKHQSNEPPTPYVNLDLPEILKEPLILESFSFNIKPNNAVPYGNLKHGSKPTYREWNKTHRNILQPAILTTTNDNVIVSERETRMKILRERIRHKNQLLENPPYTLLGKVEQNQLYPLLGKVEPNANSTLAVAPSGDLVQPFPKVDLVQPFPKVDLVQPFPKVDLVQPFPKVDLAPPLPKVDKVETGKRVIKRTIRKKYTLGKSKIRRSVAVLLKDNKTRKNIITAQKELKRQPINDVKQYLREHNLIKVGSSAPNELIRKTYEYSMLAGDITNNNKDTLLHNFMKGGEQ
jgi:hypothetical protein